jgi:tRNA threonylcarbamoyladenosine biosynthesis protein TsaB
MIILAIRTDKPKAEIGLYENKIKLAYKTWTAHRRLAETIHSQIQTMLESQSKTWTDIEGVVCFKGPGSFTGLRIGIATANALATANRIPIVGVNNSSWIEDGVKALQKGESGLVVPEYGAEAHTTTPKK